MSPGLQSVIIGVSLIIAFSVVSQTGFGYPITGSAVKAENATISAGITPDSFFYFLDVALDNINLALTFNSAEKARKSLDVARERLMEVREMVNQNKLTAAQAAQKEHANALGLVQSSVTGIEKANSTEKIENEIEIEKELEEHKTEVEEVSGELKVKIKVEGNATKEQQASIDSVLAKLNGKVGEVEVEIENEKDRTKTEIEQETGKSAEEIDNEIDTIEDKTGLKEIRKEKAWDKIKDAEKEINKTVKELTELNVTSGNVTSALNILAQAKEAFSIKDYKEATRLAKQAEKQVDDYKEESDEEPERDIEIEITGNQSRVKVEVGGTKATFILGTANRQEIISEIASRTGLSVSEIENIMNVETEKPEEEIQIDVTIGEKNAEIKTEINNLESRFTLNSTDKEEIIPEIMNRMNLSKEQVEKNAEFEIQEQKESEEESASEE